MSNTDKLKEEILSSRGSVLIDFYAPWCGPCRVQKSILKYFMEDYGDNVKLIAVDIDNNEELSEHFNIRSVPTILFMKDGKVLSRKSGIQSEEALLKMIYSQPL